MSNLWPKFTKQNPCPACQRWDWTCRMGDKLFICMRASSNRPAKDGGWYHSIGDKPKPYLPVRKSAPRLIDADKIIAKSEKHELEALAIELGVSLDSLNALEVGWNSEHQAWAVPMRDGANKIIGIHLRKDDGSKLAIKGSQNGLFIAQKDLVGIPFIVEGMSNTAALLDMGFWACGRPSCNTGGEQLKSLLKAIGAFRAVLVSDNDPMKNKPNGETFRPGQDGIKKLQKELGVKSVIYTTPNPIKDVRGLLNKFGAKTAKTMIEQSISQKTWTNI